MIVTHIPGYHIYNLNNYIKEQKAQKTWKEGDDTTAFEKEYYRVVENTKDPDANPANY